MEAKHKNEEARKAKKGKKGGNDQFVAPGRHLGDITGRLRPRHARGRHLGTNSAAKFSFREIRVSTPYISFLTPPKPLSKPHLH